MERSNTGNVSIEESDNHAPVAPGSLQKTWNRLSSVLSRRQRDTGEDEVERGEHQQPSKGTLHFTEGSHEDRSEAGAAATQNQHQSPFSSTAFNQLQSVPVVDIFFSSWWLILALRTATRPVVIYFSYFWVWSSSLFGFSSLVILATYLLRWAFLKFKRTTIPILGSPIPGKRQLFWGLSHWIQKFWVSPACASESEGLLTSSNRSIS